MLSEFNQVESEYGEAIAADLRKACRYLLRHQFIYSGDRGSASIYDSLVDPRLRRVIAAFFDSLGYRIHYNAEDKWIGIILDDGDETGGPRLRLDETIVLLLLASHWQSEVERGEVDDRAEVRGTFNLLYERYRDLVARSGTTTITAGRFTEILTGFEQRNILWLGMVDPDVQDRDVVIRSMVKLLTGDDALRRIEDFAKTDEFLAAGARLNAGEPADGEALN